MWAAWAWSAAGVAGSLLLKTVLGMASELLTEQFIRQALVNGLEYLAGRTESEKDNEALETAKKIWNKNDEKNQNNQEEK